MYVCTYASLKPVMNREVYLHVYIYICRIGYTRPIIILQAIFVGCVWKCGTWSLLSWSWLVQLLVCALFTNFEFLT